MHSITGWLRRLTACGAIALGTITLAAAPATAEPTLFSDDRFRSAGVRIFDEEAVSLGCRIFGFCDDATFAKLSDDAVTRKRSAEKGEPVVVDCSLNDLLKVTTYAAVGGATLLTGWASASAIAVQGPTKPC